MFHCTGGELAGGEPNGPNGLRKGVGVVAPAAMNSVMQWPLLELMGLLAIRHGELVCFA